MLAPLKKSWRALLAKTKWPWKVVRYELHRRLLSNRSSRRRFRSQEPRLDDLQRELVEGLRQHGIAITRFDELIGDGQLWDALKHDIDAFAREAMPDAGPSLDQPGKKADYYVSRWAARHSESRSFERRVSLDDPWIQLGLSGRVLDVVNAYRQLWTKLIYIDNVYTVPFPESERRVGSQNWHRDPEDLHVVKVFLYFSDVDDEAGPFEYIRGSASGGRYGDLWPWRVRGGVYPPADELESLVAPEDRVSANGAAGTLIFCDTSGWHRGGFAKSKPRTLSNHAYVSPASVAARTQSQLRVDGISAGSVGEAARFALANGSRSSS